MEGREILAFYQEVNRRGGRARSGKPRGQGFAGDDHIGAIGFAIEAALRMRRKLELGDPILGVMGLVCHWKDSIAGSEGRRLVESGKRNLKIVQ